MFALGLSLKPCIQRQYKHINCNSKLPQILIPEILTISPGSDLAVASFPCYKVYVLKVSYALKMEKAVLTFHAKRRDAVHVMELVLLSTKAKIIFRYAEIAVKYAVTLHNILAC